MKLGTLVAAASILALGAAFGPSPAEADHHRSDRGRRSGHERSYRGHREHGHRYERGHHQVHRRGAHARPLHYRGHYRGRYPRHHYRPYSPRRYWRPAPPVVYAPPPRVYAPPPVYYAPPPRYYAPARPAYAPYPRHGGGVHGSVSVGLPFFGFHLYF